MVARWRKKYVSTLLFNRHPIITHQLKLKNKHDIIYICKYKGLTSGKIFIFGVILVYTQKLVLFFLIPNAKHPDLT